jgi:O-antigen ligase
LPALLDARWLILPAGLFVAGTVGLLAGRDPALALAAALALAYLLIAVSSLSAGLVAFTLLAFLELVPNATGPAVSVTKLAGVVLAISWFAYITSSNDRRKLFPAAHPAITTLLLLFLAWNTLSMVWAPDPQKTLVSSASFALNFALFPIVYTAVRSTRDVRYIAAAFVAGAVVAAFYGVIAQPDATNLATSATPAEGLNRLAGTIGDPNELATLLAAGIALTALFIFDSSRPAPLRLAALAAAGIQLVTILLTVSRGGLVALAAALVAGVLVAGRYRVQAIFATVVVVAISLLFFFSYTTPEARERITTADGGSGRTDIWKVGWRMVEDKPIAGVGAAGFQDSSIHYLLAPGPIRFDQYVVDQPAVAHNAYLEVLAETGVVGLIPFVGIIGACLVAMARAARNFSRSGDRGGELMTGAVVVAVAALLAGYFFLSEQNSKYLWLLLSLGPALLAISRETQPGRG